jgi:hypothetical protein
MIKFLFLYPRISLKKILGVETKTLSGDSLLRVSSFGRCTYFQGVRGGAVG